MSYPIHPLAHLLPEMRDDEYAELREDIGANGQREPITLYQGQVLDGRHRQRACDDLGVIADYRVYNGDEPAAYVLSLNVKRRQLTASEKALTATKFIPAVAEEAKARQRAGQERGREARFGSAPIGANPDAESAKASEQVAKLIGVSPRMVERAKRVVEQAPDLAEKVERGEMSVSTADEQIAARKRQEALTASLRGEQPAMSRSERLDASELSEREKTRNAAAARKFTEFTMKLEAYAEGIGNLDKARIRTALEPAELAEWTRSFGASLRKLGRFKSDLQES